MMKTFLEFIIENKMNDDEFLNIFGYFYKILKIHEEFYYNDDKISKDKSFKEKINVFFEKLRQGKTFRNLDIDLPKKELKKLMKGIVTIESFYVLVEKYEKKLYNDNKITPDWGGSFWDVCDVFVEDPDTLTINRYIQDFSKDDIYSNTENEEDNIKSAEKAIKNLDEILDKTETDDYWIEEDDIEKNREVFYNLFKEEFGVVPNFVSNKELADWLNDTFTLSYVSDQLRLIKK